MLRARLVLLKQLLAPTGSIYVHLDWHAVHYVKVLMDEMFGYENFRNEIIWKRTFAHSDRTRVRNRSTTRILFYGVDRHAFWKPQYTALTTPTTSSRTTTAIDPTTGKRYRLTL